MMMIVIETAMCLTVACLCILIPKVISGFNSAFIACLPTVVLYMPSEVFCCLRFGSFQCIW